jgi:hypothetical protein
MSAGTALIIIKKTFQKIPLYSLFHGIVLFPISYETTPDALVIHTGVLKTRISYAEIHSLRESRSVLSSPALSLHRIEIHYGEGRSVLVSPQNKAAFLEEIQARASHL